MPYVPFLLGVGVVFNLLKEFSENYFAQLITIRDENIT